MTIARIPPQFLGGMNRSLLDTTSSVIDAAGESVAGWGVICFEAGATGSKTISAAGGGSIIWRSAAVTFANGSTNVRVGLQDVSGATGVEDGTFDVYGDLTGGGGGITANAYLNTDMTSGTKTVSEGETVAIAIEMTARGGADSVAVDRCTNALSIAAFPAFYQGSADTGSGPAKTGTPLIAHILFDDGTVGWIAQTETMPLSAVTTISFNSGSTPDEYAGTFALTVPTQVIGIGIHLSGIAAGENYEVILYEDPYGTPSLLEIGANDPDIGFGYITFTPRTLAAGTTYGIAARPTTAGNIILSHYDLTTGFSALKKSLSIPNLKLAGRTNQTGAFTETQTYHVPIIGLMVTGYDDGASAGGLKYPFAVNGGLV